MAIKVWPYKQGSRSARSLAQALGGRVLRRVGGSYSPCSGDTIINWGDSSCPHEGSAARVLNPPSKLSPATNKLLAFRVLAEAGVQVPRFATTGDSVSWDGLTVVRHKLTGHSGEGIEIVEPGQPLPPAPLYVEYIKKEDEYRVHIIGSEVLLVQRKARDKSVEQPNWRVRNHANGFIFVRNGVNPPTSVIEQAKATIVALGLDFGAVDVIYNRNAKKAYVLEVNTAPGMEGSTIADYAKGFQEYLNA